VLQKYKYRALKASGQQVRGVLTAVSEQDLDSQLESAGLTLISCSKVRQKGAGGLEFGKKVKIRDLIQFFVNLKQMQGAGIGILESLADLRDTADNDKFRDILSEMYRDISEGSSLSEAMQNHPKVFENIHVSLVAAGEDNGDIKTACEQLVVYLKWVDLMQTRVRKATRYPMVLMVAVVATVVVMMGFVVPKIVDFILGMDQELPFSTRSLIATSDFFSQHWLIILISPIALIVLTKVLKSQSEAFAYNIDSLWLKSPIAGSVIRKISIARFSQTFSALFKGGIDIMKALNSATQTVNNRVLKEGLEEVQKSVKEGLPISEALNKSGEFPSMVVRMVKVGEESGNLSEVLDQVSEFYTNDVDEEVQNVISMIEPALTGILGVMILWIAVGVFGPIYSSFENIDI